MSSLLFNKRNSIGKYFPVIGTIKGYNRGELRKDLIAALTVAVVAIPQSMAYAFIAGVNPVYGLYTAIISAIFGSAFGSSKQMVTGPTNTICLLVAGGMKNYIGIGNDSLLFLLTFLVGTLQLLFGVLRLGKLIDFVSHTVLVGFTAGAGVLIAIGQLIHLSDIPAANSAQMSSFELLYYISTHLHQANLCSLGLGLLTIAIMTICQKINRKLPDALIGIIVPVFLLICWSLEVKGVKLVGSIPAALPNFTMVRFSLEGVQNVFQAALAISIIGLVESISISKSIAITSGQKIDANQEFIGQGLANTAASFFQGIPASGSFSRSALNYSNGAATRLSGIFSGMAVAIVLVFLAPLAKYIPQACLAGVLMVAAYNLVDLNEFKNVLKVGELESDSAALWITFLAMIFIPNLCYAIYTGIALSIILYLKDSHKANLKILVPGYNSKEREIKNIKGKYEVIIIQLQGNLYFGSSSDLEYRLSNLVDKTGTFILRMNYVTSIDITTLETLEEFVRIVKENGGTVIISDVKPELRLMLEKVNILPDITEN